MGRGRVHWLGYRRDLARVAEAGDLYVLGSDSDGTPVSLIESAAAARPRLVAATACLCRELVAGRDPARRA